MTQAFNLGQLANKVNTSGQLDASTGLVNSAAVANGGTGRATLTAGTVLLGNGTSQVTMLAGTTTNDALIWSGSAWASSPVASAGGGGGYTLTSYTSPSSYTKPASLKSIKVTVVGAGGNGGTTPNPAGTFCCSGGGSGGASIYYAPAASLPASAITVTAGAGTNSFGAIASATAGSPGGTIAVPQMAIGGASGVGSGGTININGNNGNPSNPSPGGAGISIISGMGGNSILSGNSQSVAVSPTGGVVNGNAGNIYGGGGSGAVKGGTIATATGGTGANGVVIIEEFF
jgi:hypothetical protein